jgi:outer membrane protein
MVTSKASFMFLAGLFSWFLILQPEGGLAQEKKVYTLKASISEALSNNWALKARQEKVGQAGYAKSQAGAEFYPKLSTSYGYTRLNESPFVEFMGQQYSIGTRDNYQWKSTITQPLFTGFALSSSYRLAELGVDQSEMSLEMDKLDLALRVKEAYFGILKADKALDVAVKAVESLESNVKVARSFYKVGMIPINDLLKAEVELSNAEFDLVKARNVSRLARSNFNNLLSRPTNEPVEVEDVLVFEPEMVDFESLLDEALNNRPEMKLLEIYILQADQQITLAQSKYYPEVALTYDYIKQGDSADVSGSPYQDANQWQAMAVASWTFWEWGKTYYSVQQGEGLKKELLQSRMETRENIALDLKTAILALADAEEKIPTTRKAVEQGEENLRVSEERYKAQVSTITEVLDAQTLLTQARTNYFNAFYDHKLAKARLQRALGKY